MTNEAFARVKIDQLLKDTEWRLTDGLSVRYEYPLDDGGRADYALFDRQGRALAVLEAKSTSVNLSAGERESSNVKERRHEALATVRLVNKDGDVIWSTTQESGGAKFRGASADVAEKITRQLSADVDRLRKAK